MARHAPEVKRGLTRLYPLRVPAFLTLVAFVFAWAQVIAQGPTMVSLLEELNRESNDTARVDILNRIALKHLELNQFDKGYERSTEAYTLSRKVGYIRGEAESWESIGLYHDYRNQFRDAIDAYNTALHLFEYLDDSSLMARNMNSIGLQYKYISSFDTALVYFYRSKEIVRLIGDNDELAQTFNLIGVVYGAWGDYKESLENFMAAMDLFQTGDNSLGMSNTYTLIGSIYCKLGEFRKAEDYLEIALSLNMDHGPTRDIIDIYTEMGLLYAASGRQQESIEMFEKSLSLARYYNNKRKVAEGFDNIGKVHQAMSNYEEALRFFNRAVDIRQELKIAHGLMVSKVNIAGVYLGMIESMGASREGTPAPSHEMVFQLLDNALEEARRIGNYDDLVATYQTLVRASAGFRNYNDAVMYQRALLDLKDSVAGINQNRSLAELQTRFDRDRQEQEITLLKSNREVQEALMNKQRVERLIYSLGGISLVLLIIGLLNRIAYMIRARRELEARNIEIGEEKQKAEESERVKEQFLSKMNHEIRIPMNTIMGSVNILLKNKHLDEQQKYLGAIRQSSENLLVIIDDILDLTSLEAGRVRLEEVPFNIAGELQNIEQMLSFKAAEKGIDLHTQAPDNLPASVIGDPIRLSQVLMNLAGNGIKFTEKGSVTIAVAVAGHENDRVTLHFEVRDTGIGIPADRLDNIFRSFTQADSDTTRKYGGTGLGLTISKQLVEMQGGTLMVESKPGRGSRFFFDIAYRVEESGAPSRHRMPEIREDILKGLKILVVEDDEFNVMVLHDTLTTALEGVTLYVANDGKEALDKWAEVEPDIILLDIELPEMNGHEVARAIRRSGRMGNGVPIIAMTANALPKEMEECFNSGMNEFVSKPFDPDELLMKINKLLLNQQQVRS